MRREIQLERLYKDKVVLLNSHLDTLYQVCSFSYWIMTHEKALSGFDCGL